jgi:hypothetical protein
MMRDGFGDHGSEPRHALAEPRWNTAIVKRQIGASCSSSHESPWNEVRTWRARTRF